MTADLSPLRLLLVTLAGWVNRHQQLVVEYLGEENRVLKEQLKGRRVRVTDDQRRRLAAKGRRLGRRVLRQVATIVTPDTILRWHRRLIARKWTFALKRPGRPGVMKEIASLILRMATENPAWGYSRIQGALKNLDHRVARSTVAAVLKDHGIPPAPGRSSSWRTFLRAHWGEIADADFFTSEVWTSRGLVTYYTLFVLDLRSRRVHVAGSTPNPDATFMTQAAWHLTDAVDGFLSGHRVLLCDRDGKWTEGFRSIMEGAGVRVVLTPFQAPNANAYAERFVRSIREECLDHLILFGERRLLRALDEFVEHYHKERNHQGLANDLIVPERRSGRGDLRSMRGAVGRGIAVLPPRGLSPVRFFRHYRGSDSAVGSHAVAVGAARRFVWLKTADEMRARFFSESLTQDTLPQDQVLDSELSVAVEKERRSRSPWSNRLSIEPRFSSDAAGRGFGEGQPSVRGVTKRWEAHRHWACFT